MSQANFGKQYKIKPRFFIILALLLALLVWGVVSLAAAMRPPRIQWGRLANDQAISAVVLRDETLVQAKANAKLSCIAAEGEAVQRDQPIAMLYTSGYSEKDLEKLIELRAYIKDYQENNIIKNIQDKDLEAINGKINTKMDEISTLTAQGKTQSLLVYEKELKDLMEQRRLYMLEFVKADEHLNKQYTMESNLQAKIDETRQQVTAPAEGLVSFYLDGFESYLTVAALETMTPEQVRDISGDILSKRTAKAGGEVVEAQQPVCRIVNPSRWYALAVLGSRENPLSEGNTQEVTFDGLKEPVQAKAVKVVNQGRNALVVLEMTAGVQEMLSLRLINGRIGRDISGFLVPVNMLKEDGGKIFLSYRQPQGGVKTVEISVLAKNAKSAVIAEAGADTGALAVGMELVKP